MSVLTKHSGSALRPSAFALSPRRYPCPLLRFQVDAPWNHAARIDRDGFLRWNGKPLFISTALGHEDAELRYESELKGRMADQVAREVSERVSAMSSD